jgi:hypothetical protein
MKNTKKDIMGVKNISVLIGENEISHLKINENENNFMGNLYDHGLPTFGNKLFIILYYLNKFKSINIFDFVSMDHH